MRQLFGMYVNNRDRPAQGRTLKEHVLRHGEPMLGWVTLGEGPMLQGAALEGLDVEPAGKAYKSDGAMSTRALQEIAQTPKRVGGLGG